MSKKDTDHGLEDGELVYIRARVVRRQHEHRFEQPMVQLTGRDGKTAAENYLFVPRDVVVRAKDMKKGAKGAGD